MYNFNNSSVIYVSQKNGDDMYNNGLAPLTDKFGNGPFKTIRRAVNSVAERRLTGFNRPMTIALTDDYYTDETICINLEKDKSRPCILQTAGHSITIESYGERRRIIGGQKITNWEYDVFNGVKCISAKLPEKSDGSKWDFSDLYIDGKRAELSKYPKTGYLKGIKTECDFSEAPPLKTSSRWFIADKSTLEGVTGIENAIVSFYHYWVDAHSPVESYDYESGKLVMKYKTRFTLSTVYEPVEHSSALKFYLENIPSAFSDVNEWYLDKNSGKIYYIPEDLSRHPAGFEAYIPTVEKLIDIQGNSEERICDIRLRNLELMCTKGEYVSRAIRNPETGRTEYSHDEEFAYDNQSASSMHGAVSFRNATRCTISDCLIHSIGTHAIEVKTGCEGIRIENNDIYETGGGGVRIFGGEYGCDNTEITRGNVVRGNHISNGGKRYAAGCGILVCHSANNEISENEISHLNYSGISVGWVWGYSGSSSYGNIIKRNHIHHIGFGKLSDMGGIYLLGKQQGTIVSENRVHDICSAHYGGYGIYTDEGSSYITIENNVVYNTKSDSFYQHYGSYNVVRNNIFAMGLSAVNVSMKEIHDGVCLENNIFVIDGTTIYSRSTSLATISSKKNIIWDISVKAPIMLRRPDGNIEYNFDEWTSGCGKDVDSIVADPCFKNLAEFDFTLRDDSPAIKLGFKPLTGFLASGKK